MASDSRTGIRNVGAPTPHAHRNAAQAANALSYHSRAGDANVKNGEPRAARFAPRVCNHHSRGERRPKAEQALAKLIPGREGITLTRREPPGYYRTQFPALPISCLLR
jgi:hypothetical protein